VDQDWPHNPFTRHLIYFKKEIPIFYSLSKLQARVEALALGIMGVPTPMIIFLDEVTPNSSIASGTSHIG
jgi:hypothetical protein